MVVWTAAWLVVAWTGTLHAQEQDEETAAASAPAQADDPPWTRGVSEEQRSKANEYHARGLKAAKELFYKDALALYSEALEYWDHPKIRYNTAFVLIKLNQPLAAREHLLQAVKYKEAPLGAETYQNALNYLELINRQLAEVEIACDEDGVEVTLDGESMLASAGSATKLVRPGNHQLVAKKPGLPTLVHRVPLWAEQRHRIEVSPSRAVYQRWPPWVPWVVLGSGAGAMAVGGLLQWRAQANFDEFDRIVARECPPGCSEDELAMRAPDALSFERWGRWENRFAGGFLLVGGVATAAGAAMLWLNRPQQHDERAFDISVTPMLTPAAAGVSARGSF